MQDIVIACTTKAEAERAMRLAADLSMASGARLSLLAATSVAVTVDASAGLDAVAHLSTVLFTNDRRGHSPVFGRPHVAWLDDFEARVHHCASTDHLADAVTTRQPDLVIAGNSDIARELVEHTPVPVWHLRSRERSWFSARRVRCATRGARAQAFAERFAASLNIQLDTAPARRFGNAADLMVFDREHHHGWPSGHPLVLV